MASQQGKGKRQDTPEQSDRRDRSWKRGQERKAARVAAQMEREARNKDRRDVYDIPTPWQTAKAVRRLRRARPSLRRMPSSTDVSA